MNLFSPPFQAEKVEAAVKEVKKKQTTDLEPSFHPFTETGFISVVALLFLVKALKISFVVTLPSHKMQGATKTHDTKKHLHAAKGEGRRSHWQQRNASLRFPGEEEEIQDCTPV